MVPVVISFPGQLSTSSTAPPLAVCPNNTQGITSHKVLLPAPVGPATNTSPWPSNSKSNCL